MYSGRPRDGLLRASTLRRLARHADVLFMLVLPLLVLAVWWLAPVLTTISPIFLPSPATVWGTAIQIFTHGYRSTSIWQNIAYSFSHLLYAFGIITVIGVPLGWMMGRSHFWRRLFDPLVEFLRPLPPLAYLSLLIIWFGVGHTTQIILLTIAGFPVLVTAARSAASAVPEERLKTAAAFGAKGVQVFWYVIFPSGLPELITGMRLLSGMLFGTVVAAEMISSRQGLGWMILDASDFLRSDVIFVGIFIMAALGFSMDRGFRLLERLVVPWKGRG